MLSERAKKIGLEELSIFDQFEIDYKLPKFIINKKSTGLNIGDASWVDNDEEFDDQDDMDNLPNSGGRLAVPANGNWNNPKDSEEKLTFRESLIKWLSKNQKEIPLTKEITILQFFASLTRSFEELKSVEEISIHYEKALLQSKIMGQISLNQQLKAHLHIIRGEAQLISAKVKQYVTEKQLIDFYKKVGEDKNLKLTWIKNFSRIIPEEIYNIKKDLDCRKIFDNYVILHYDPAGESVKLTEEEIEKKKDPILFGLMQNSRKLYYIADWKDDYCQLTLEEMFTTLGEKVLTINNKNVKSFINKLKG